MYVVTFVVFLVLSERLEQAASKHVCKFFWNIKQYFEVIKLNKTLKAANRKSPPNYHEEKLGFLTCFWTLFFLLFLLFIGIIVMAQKT